MGFKEDLEQICGKVEGSFAASVMGFDGIPIETVEARPPDGIELQTLLIEYSGILSQVRQAAGQQLARWQRRASHPASTRAVRDAAEVLVRICERLLAQAGTS